MRLRSVCFSHLFELCRLEVFKALSQLKHVWRTVTEKHIKYLLFDLSILEFIVSYFCSLYFNRLSRKMRVGCLNLMLFPKQTFLFARIRICQRWKLKFTFQGTELRFAIFCDSNCRISSNFRCFVYRNIVTKQEFLNCTINLGLTLGKEIKYIRIIAKYSIRTVLLKRCDCEFALLFKIYSLTSFSWKLLYLHWRFWSAKITSFSLVFMTDCGFAIATWQISVSSVRKS